MKSFLIFIFSLFTLSVMCSQQAFAQHNPLDSIMVAGTFYKGDTIPLSYLSAVKIIGNKKWKNDSERLAYQMMKNDVVIVYPYAQQASQLLVQINNELAGIHNSRERRRFIKSKEKVLNDQFKNQLINMTTVQGKLLMLLIDRQTGSTCFELIKEFRGGFKAWTYNAMMSIYDDDLNMKRRYTKEEYPTIERILNEIERGQMSSK